MLYGANTYGKTPRHAPHLFVPCLDRLPFPRHLQHQRHHDRHEEYSRRVEFLLAAVGAPVSKGTAKVLRGASRAQRPLVALVARRRPRRVGGAGGSALALVLVSAFEHLRTQHVVAIPPCFDHEAREGARERGFTPRRSLAARVLEFVVVRLAITTLGLVDAPEGRPPATTMSGSREVVLL